LPSQIVEEPLYTEQINALRVDWKRLDEAFMTLEHAILTVPDVFPLVPGTILRRCKIVGFRDVPPLSIYFAVRGDKAHLVAAELLFSDDEVLGI
jgi:hypothetical protein